jgi:hypothetical protein
MSLNAHSGAQVFLTAPYFPPPPLSNNLATSAPTALHPLLSPAISLPHPTPPTHLIRLQARTGFFTLGRSVSRSLPPRVGVNQNTHARVPSPRWLSGSRGKHFLLIIYRIFKTGFVFNLLKLVTQCWRALTRRARYYLHEYLADLSLSPSSSSSFSCLCEMLSLSVK